MEYISYLLDTIKYLIENAKNLEIVSRLVFTCYRKIKKSKKKTLRAHNSKRK